jgi:hypothetical protein
MDQGLLASVVAKSVRFRGKSLDDTKQPEVRADFAAAEFPLAAVPTDKPADVTLN